MNSLFHIIHRFLNLTFIRFVLVGILNTCFGVGVYCLFIYLGLQYAIATLLSNILGVVWNFKTTGRLVFGSKGNKLIYRFALCYCFAYILNIAFIFCFTKIGFNDYYSGIFATPLIALCSYSLLKRFVFLKAPRHADADK